MFDAQELWMLRLLKASEFDALAAVSRERSIQSITSERPVIRPGTMPSGEITAYKPTLTSTNLMADGSTISS